MNRFDHLHRMYREAKMRERKRKILNHNRSEVDINANGTSGYVVKNGPNVGRILAHNSPKSTNNW
jgi:hypothetical protein